MIDLGGDVTGNGISKLVFTILSAVAEAERDRIRERIADVKRDQKTRGRFLGGSRPFGWQIAADGSLEPLESERKACWQCAGCRRRARACAPSRARCRSAGLQSRIRGSSRCWRALTRQCDLAGTARQGMGRPARVCRDLIGPGLQYRLLPHIIGRVSTIRLAVVPILLFLWIDPFHDTELDAPQPGPICLQDTKESPPDRVAQLSCASTFVPDSGAVAGAGRRPVACRCGALYGLPGSALRRPSCCSCTNEPTTFSARRGWWWL